MPVERKVRITIDDEMIDFLLNDEIGEAIYDYLEAHGCNVTVQVEDISDGDVQQAISS
jgi:hypothetical protein